jgi:hypothetical protein
MKKQLPELAARCSFFGFVDVSGRVPEKLKEVVTAEC